MHNLTTVNQLHGSFLICTIYIILFRICGNENEKRNFSFTTERNLGKFIFTFLFS